MNRTEYVARHLAQKSLAAVGMIRLQEFLKRKTGRWNAQLSPDFFHRRMTEKMSVFNRIGLRLTGRVVEQGTGWYGLDPILFYLGGASRIDTYDTTPWLNKELFVAAAKSCLANLDLFESWKHADRNLVAERSQSIRRMLEVENSASLTELLEHINTRYTCTKTMRRAELESNSVEFFYTDSVLQRIERKDLNKLVSEACRILCDGGRTYHVVDCKDFHSIGNKAIPECWYLTIPESLYNAMTSRYVNFQNRLRMPDFLQIFDSVGFDEISIPAKTITPDNEEFCRANRDRIASAGKYDISDVAVSRFELTATKRS